MVASFISLSEYGFAPVKCSENYVHSVVNGCAMKATSKNSVLYVTF